jgi:hypothetical protein
MTNPMIAARTALKDAVKYALDTEVDASTQMELWRHFQGVSAICRELKLEETIEFKLSDSSFLSDYTVSADAFGAAAATDNISLTTNNDTVVFG